MFRIRIAGFWFFMVCSCALTPRDVFAQAQPRPPLPDYLAVAIPDAIDRGKSFLQRTQQKTGTWSADKSNAYGYAALPALTLLECGVPPTDPGIQAAANYIRFQINAKDFNSTYEVALAVLFLDRLGNPKDKPYIRTLAVRLIAGQTHTGGWSYRVPILDTKDTAIVLKYVQDLEPLPLHHLLSGRVAGMNNPFVKREPVSSSELAAKRNVKIIDRLKLLPCFTQFGAFKLVDPEGKGQEPIFGTTDNSTTQFALLALWAARRHDVPCTRTGSLAFMRFHTCQNSDGSWGYPYRDGGSGGSPAMINTGLLGMAVGHGIVKEMKLDDDPPVDEDPRILNAFKALANHIEAPKDQAKDLPFPNLYFLWSLERVCMLYGVETVGAKDWYRSGAEMLIANQDQDGSWHKKENYPGAAPPIDTSFALMFLKRANLAKDLSAYLKFSPKKLNEGVVKLMPQVVTKPDPKPEPPKVVETKPMPEPPKVVETKPEPKPIQVAESKPVAPVMAPPPVGSPQVAPTPPAESGGNTWVIWAIIGLGGFLIVGGLLFFFLFSGGGSDQDEDGDDEDDRPRKTRKPKRR